ncbi:sigma-70 family RNA polymerase sigma factor [Planctomycetota bacterium]
MQADSGSSEQVMAAGRIFDEYGDAIMDMIKLYLPDRGEADDIFQELFLSLVYNPMPEGIGNVRGYLYRTIRNDVFDASRRLARYQRRLRRYLERRGPSQAEPEPDRRLQQFEQVRQLYRMVEECFCRREAQALIRRYGYQESTEETAKAMCVDKRTVYRYICVGLKKIRKRQQFAM